MGHGNFKGAYEATQQAIAMNPKYVVVGHGRSGQPALITTFADIYRALRDSVQKYYEQGLADYEMKDKVVADLAEFKDWHSMDQLGRVISFVYQQVEAAAF